MTDDRCPLCLRQRRNCTCSCRPDDVLGPEPYRAAGPGVVRETYEDLQRQLAEKSERYTKLRKTAEASEAELAAIIEVIERVEDPRIARDGRSVHDWLAQILQVLVTERDNNAVALVKIRLALASIPWDVMKTIGPPYRVVLTPNAFNGLLRIVELLDSGIQQAIDTLDPKDLKEMENS